MLITLDVSRIIAMLKVFLHECERENKHELLSYVNGFLGQFVTSILLQTF